MNKKEFIAQVAQDANITKIKTGELYDVFVNTMVDAMTAGEEVFLPELGKFVLVEKAERVARNPQTGEEVIVPAKTAIKFKPCKALKEAVKEL